MIKLFSRVKRVNEYATVEARELPDGGIVVSGTTYNPKTEETIMKPLLFSPEAAYILHQILNEWVLGLSEVATKAINESKEDGEIG